MNKSPASSSKNVVIVLGAQSVAAEDIFQEALQWPCAVLDSHFYHQKMNNSTCEQVLNLSEKPNETTKLFCWTLTQKQPTRAQGDSLSQVEFRVLVVLFLMAGRSCTNRSGRPLQYEGCCSGLLWWKRSWIKIWRPVSLYYIWFLQLISNLWWPDCWCLRLNTSQLSRLFLHMLPFNIRTSLIWEHPGGAGEGGEGSRFPSWTSYLCNLTQHHWQW